MLSFKNIIYFFTSILFACGASKTSTENDNKNVDKEKIEITEKVVETTTLVHPEFVADSSLMKEEGVFGVTVGFEVSTLDYDLDGDGENDKVSYSYDSVNSQHIISINDKLYKQKDYKSWGDKSLMIIDINKNDDFLEVLFYQHFDDDEDPARENIIITYHDDKIKASVLSGSDYNAGTLSIKGDDTVNLYLSSCPNYDNDYFSLKNGKLEKVKSSSVPNPDFPNGECPACFIGSSKVATGVNQYQKIENLKEGNAILTYNFENNKTEITTIEEIITVKHEKMVVLYFAAEIMRTDNFGYDSIVTTYDHPFFVEGKGWSSFTPKVTSLNYTNYREVSKYAINDKFKFIHEGKVINKVLIEIGFMNKNQKTYTISKLKKGDNFLVNGAIVGVEEIKTRAEK